MTVLTVLDAEEAAALLARVRSLDFVDGRATARGGAKDRKANTQARQSGAEFEQVQADVVRLLSTDPRVRDVAFPRTVSSVLVNRYGPGDSYGLHVDRAVLSNGAQPMRTDLSFTLFLTPLEDYEGGELQIAAPHGMRAHRLQPGSIVIYPTHYLHQVTPVTSGERISIVGWIESWIPDPHYREVMTKLRAIQGSVDSAPVSAMVRLQLGEVVEDLIRYGASR